MGAKETTAQPVRKAGSLRNKSKAKLAEAQKINQQRVAWIGAAVGNALQKPNSLMARSDTASKLSVQATLDQRGSVYGSFRDNSRAAISLLNVINEFNGLRIVPLPDYELNALVMIAEKMSRVLTGKSHEDNWIDMAGYSELGRNPR